MTSPPGRVISTSLMDQYLGPLTAEGHTGQNRVSRRRLYHHTTVPQYRLGFEVEGLHTTPSLFCGVGHHQN